MRHLLLLLSSLLLSLCASAREPQHGYRGFADLSLTPYIDISLYGNPSDSYCYVGMTTSHGYQFNPHLFVGGGFAFEVDTKHSQLIVPVFAHVRGDFRIRRFTPFAEARLGANLADGPGIFFAPSVGYRFDWGRRIAINLGLGINLFGTREKYYDHIPEPGGGIVPVFARHYNATHVLPAIRLGVDF